ncbi:hypothetical protein CBM2615_A120162 [Cupriavidus taiwanensis]|uniref:Uncharacterized protein n=1 Tax=Cupriavidus taiwanensis TaxID=164546 RepID=A0A375DVN1_9BURK|nr:hypothetical protein [Cupriavidus taiwanensis]SOZ49341.1 hypothetical protein CBM2615_A120162 [Cupriavidus taiwanensis]SOZ49411.1 hypothetical protein CBM2614_A120159 [Cupriavidus taiwanensis]SOZ52006.1 hypothetical protein CBM2613_A110161 [Cupriavidus taiwanensis]SPA07170.1 hypothetical protein CBM2625_A90159 [Cupriavidus taiwanensis]
MMEVMPIYGPEGWCERGHGKPLVESDKGLRYFLTSEIKDELIAAGLIFTVSTRLMTDDPGRLREALVEILKRRSKARAARRIAIEQGFPLRSVEKLDESPA